MNTVDLGSELLRVVNSAEEILRRVSAEESSAPILAGGWSRRQVMGHLIDSASNNHQRFVRASLADSLEFPGYEQNDWARVQAAEQADWPLLVALWANYNRYIAHVLARLPLAKLEVPVRIGQGEPVTLKFLAEDYLRHLVHHIGQIDAVAVDGGF
ncbi:MAG: DinB family protein [Terriglobia bacterium]